MTDKQQLPKYRCHKEVHAFKIKATSIDSNSLILYPEEEGLSPVQVSMEYAQKHDPQLGGYYLYSDGYESYSPAEPFESGCTRVE